MIAKLRYILGLQTAEEKLEEYTLLKGELSDINDRTDILAEDYVTKLNGFNDILKSESYGTEIKERVQKRYTHFLQEQKKEVIGLVNRRHKIEKSITSILKDEKIKDAVNEFELLEKAKSNYRDGNISKNVYNDIIKAKKGKVHYSDNFVFWNGKLLLIQRATDDNGANKWCLPGGHVDAGESHEKAAVRELVEETGIEVKNAVLAGVYENEDVMIEYYTSSVESETEPSILLDSSEHQSYKWFDVYKESLDDMEFPFNMKENIKKILLPEEVEAKNISKAVNMFIDGYISKEVLSDIVKARTGYYSDNSENRRLKRVGQKYGTKGVKEQTNTEPKKEAPIEEYAKQASDEALNTALKQSDDNKVKQAAKEELNERKEGGEDKADQPKENVNVDTEKKQEGKNSPTSGKEDQENKKPTSEKDIRNRMKFLNEKIGEISSVIDEEYKKSSIMVRAREKRKNPDFVKYNKEFNDLRDELIRLKDIKAEEHKKEQETLSVKKLNDLKTDMLESVEEKVKQFKIIQKFNPMQDEIHVGIRSPKDIKTFGEAMEDDESFVWGDFSREDAEKALKSGKITVYSSYEIDQGVFVSTSKKQAEMYAGGGEVNKKIVDLDEVAWINGDEGQFASLKKEDNVITKSQTNQIKGGLADNLSVKDIAAKHKVDVSKIKEQLTKGIKVEMEHTDDPKKAIEIALDHLVESPIYYDELEKMESKFHDKK